MRDDLIALRRQRLPRSFYVRPTCEVAIDLLGRRLVRVRDGGVSGDTIAVATIVETEAYVGPDDRASHASRGRTKRNEVMFGPPGHAYVYLIYGRYNCLNAVTEPLGFPAAVLIRAAEPVTGVAQPTSGPGRLCRALDIDRSFNGECLAGERLFIDAGDRPVNVARPDSPIGAGPRIGVAYAGEWADRPWRYWIAGNPWVSGPRSGRR
jgi:DNA-3-methyladenine glycosylase